MSVIAPSAIDAQAKLFRGLGDPCRLAILNALRQQPATVSQLIVLTGRSQSNVSNHLACLLDCGLVQREQRGKYAIYSLADDRVATLLGLGEAIVADAAAGFFACTRYGTPERDRDGNRDD